MQIPNEQQLFELIEKSQKILIALPKNPNPDTLGSALAMSGFLKKMSKYVDVLCERKEFTNLEFLPGIKDIKNQIVLANTFVISVDTTKTKLEELSYHTNEDNVRIHLKPSGGIFTDKDISFGTEAQGYDLIICVDTPSLEHLGLLYTQNAEVFFATTKVNIDNHINNENYANINLVDITAASTAEIVLELLKNYEAGLIDKDIATCLLTGIISETNSFQHSITTPNSFLRASELINYGAQQQEIIRYLFKTKNLSMLKLWGRAMARIKNILGNGVVYTVVTMQDIERAEATNEDLLKVVQELIVNLSDLKLLFFVAELPDALEMYIYATPNIKISEVINYFGGEFISGSLGKVLFKDKKTDQVEEMLNNALNNLKVRIGL